MESPEASTRSVMDVRAKPWLAKRARAGARSWAPRGARWAWLTLGIKERPFVFDGTVHDRPPKPTPREALMRYQTFGRRTGLRLSEYVLGTANFGSAPSAAGLAGSRAIFEAYVAAGGTTFDVSNIYQNGEAERVLGELLGRERDDFAVITKYGGSRQDQVRPGTTGNSRKIMIRSLEESLRRLNTDYVDVFMPHFPDGVTPMTEILAGLEDRTRAGIRAEYSLPERSAERELLPMAEAHGLGVLLYSPLAGGLLTGKYRRGGQGRLTARGASGEATA